MKKSIILILLMTIMCGITACKKEVAKNSSISSGISSSSVVSSSETVSSSVVSSSENSSSESSSAVNAEKGRFYTLQEAYDNGWLNQEQLLSMAYYYHGGNYLNEDLMGENYTPIPKMPETLNEDIVLEIREVYFEQEVAPYDSNCTIDKIFIEEYFGTYGNCIAVIMHNVFYGPAISRVEEIGNVQFCYLNGYDPSIKIYKK